MIKTEIENRGIHSVFQLLNGSNVAVLITDALAPGHPIVFVNDAFERKTGYSASESIGKNCRFLRGDDNQQEDIQKLRHAIAQGRASDSVLRNYRKDGSLFLNHLYIYPVRDRDDVVTHFVGVQHDGTVVHDTTMDLLESRLAMEHLADVCIKLTQEGTILSANQAVRNVFDVEPEALVGTHLQSLGLHEDAQGDGCRDVTSEFLRCASSAEPVHGRYRRKDGTDVRIEWRVSKGATSPTLIALGRDVTATHRAEVEARAAREKLAAVLNSITEGCFSVDREWRFTYINDQGARWFERRPEDLIGRNIWDEFPQAVGGVFYETYQRAMSTRTYAEGDAYYAPLARWLNARAYPSEEGLTVFFMDVSDRKRDESRMLYAASHDPLTGLMNRETCLQRLERTLAGTAQRLGPLAVLFIDLDRFKEVNDALGHRAGDHVLRLLGMRLRALGTELRYCARLSGDEFLFVLDPSSQWQAQAFAQRLLDEIVQPFDVAGQRVTIGASIGIAMAAEDDLINASDLVNHADTAMYAAKAAGRLAVRMFSAETDQVVRRRLQLRSEMASAIEAGQFTLHYQPQIRLPEGDIGGVEALIRWNHPAFGLLSPAAFLDIAEESPLILKLGAWVCEEACRQLACWNALGCSLRVAINVSARQLADANFPEILHRSVRRHAVEPQSIELEITESMLAQDLQAASDVLLRLVQEGFRIALDDFGTGFSNFAYINRLPVTAIKIDRSFVTHIDHDPRAINVVKGIVALAKSLDLSVICEGIETPEQRHALEQTQCDMIQGYLISKPLTADELLARFLRPPAAGRAACAVQPLCGEAEAGATISSSAGTGASAAT